MFYTCGRGEPQGHPTPVPFFVGLPGRADAPFGGGRRERGHRIRRSFSGSAGDWGFPSGNYRRDKRTESAEGVARDSAVEKDLTLLEDLDRLVDPVTRGDPESPLRWTCKSVRRLAEELQREGHAVSYQTVAELLHALDYSLQANQKTLEGSQHADRDEQFEYINRKAQRYLKQGEPVISVDTKKKELVGDFKNAGRE